MSDNEPISDEERAEFDAHLERAGKLAETILNQTVPTFAGNRDAPSDALIAHMVVVATLARFLRTDREGAVEVFRAVWNRTLVVAEQPGSKEP